MLWPADLSRQAGWGGAPYLGTASRDRDPLVQIDILDQVKQLDPVGHGALEGFSSADEAHSAGAFVDDGGADGVGEIVLAAGAAAVDQRTAAHVAIGDLIAAKLDGMIAGREIGVDFFAGLAELQRVVTAVILCELLLDDVGLDGDAEMIGLAGEIGGEVEILFGGGESRVAKIAPEDGDQPQLVCGGEHPGNFLNLPIGFGGAEINGRADGDGAHIERLLHVAEDDLIEFVRIGEKLVVIELDQEGNLMGVFARTGAEHAERRGDCIASALDGQFDDALGIEIGGIGRKAGAGGMLDALIDGEDRNIPGPGEPAVVEDHVEISQNVWSAIAGGEDPIDEIGAGQVQGFFLESLGDVVEQIVGIGAEEIDELAINGCGHGLLLHKGHQVY
jgi:hypothetical protein